MGIGFLGCRGKPSGYLLGLFAAAGTWQQQREQTPGPLDPTTEKAFIIPVHICQNTLHQKRPAHGRC